MKLKLPESLGMWWITMLSKRQLILSLLIVMACSKAWADHLSTASQYACSPAQFRELDYKSRESEIHNCSPTEQVNLYLDWSSATVPTNFDFAESIAKTGETIIEPLMDVLERHETIADEINKPKVLIVLELMNKRGYYPLTENRALMVRISKAVDIVSDDSIRDWLLEIVCRIEKSREILGSE